MNVKFDAVTVKITPPAALDAKKRRLSAAVKARMAVHALERALVAAKADCEIATGKLKGAEVTEYMRMTLLEVA
jgi:hypothetical protein